MGPTLLVLGAVASVAGTIASIRAQKKAARAAQQQQLVADRRNRRQAIRQAQITRAQVVASAAASGASGSSSVSGGLGSLSSQLGEQFGYSTQMSALSGDINKYQARAQTYSSLASLGGTVYSYSYNQGARMSDIAPTRAPVPTAPVNPLTSSLRPLARPF